MNSGANAGSGKINPYAWVDGKRVEAIDGKITVEKRPDGSWPQIIFPSYGGGGGGSGNSGVGGNHG